MGGQSFQQHRLVPVLRLRHLAVEEPVLDRRQADLILDDPWKADPDKLWKLDLNGNGSIDADDLDLDDSDPADR